MLKLEKKEKGRAADGQEGRLYVWGVYAPAKEYTLSLAACIYCIRPGCVVFRQGVVYFFQTFLFIAPILLDLTDTRFYSKTLNFIRVFFGVINAVVLIGCFAGMAGILVDKGDSFAVSQAFLFYPGYAFDKMWVGTIIAANLAVPFVFWIGSPCQTSRHMIEKMRQLSAEKESGRV